VADLVGEHPFCSLPCGQVQVYDPIKFVHWPEHEYSPGRVHSLISAVVVKLVICGLCIAEVTNVTDCTGNLVLPPTHITLCKYECIYY
jgi:hypothetical protein